MADTQRILDWYRKGRVDALRNNPILQFDNAPTSWTKEEEESAREAYDAGADSATNDVQEYADLAFQIREAEGLACSRDTNDPTGARALLAEYRAQLAALENAAPGAAHQDGGQFYVQLTGECIADYGDIRDHDVEAAKRTRRQFLAEYGNRYTLESAETPRRKP